MIAEMQCSHSASVPEIALDESKYYRALKIAPGLHQSSILIQNSLAYVEMRIILARMIFNFDMELDQPDVDWMDQNCFTLWDKSSLMVKLHPRHAVAS